MGFNPGGRDGIGRIGGLLGLGLLILLLAVFSLIPLCGCASARVEILDREGRVVARGNLSRMLISTRDQQLSLKPDGTLVYSVGESGGAAIAGELVGAAVQSAISGATAGK